MMIQNYFKGIVSIFVMAMLGLFSMSWAQDMGAPPAPMRDQGFWQTLIMLSIAMVFFYFILWRPEQKRRKELENQRSQLKKGDRVTAMGIIGTVLRVEERTVILKMYDGAKLEMLKEAVTDVHPLQVDEIKKNEKESNKVELATVSK